MENWGLITYKEYLLFFNPDRDDFMRRRSITSVIGHELIHQWFGNTVTCDWWDEIYINEAFGSIGGFLGLIMAKLRVNICICTFNFDILNLKKFQSLEKLSYRLFLCFVDV